MKSYIQTVSEVEKKLTVILSLSELSSYTCCNSHKKIIDENKNIFQFEASSDLKNKIFDITENIFYEQHIQTLGINRFILEDHTQQDFVFSVYYAVIPSLNINLSSFTISVPPPILPIETYNEIILSFQKKHSTIVKNCTISKPKNGDLVTISTYGSINNHNAPCLNISKKTFELEENDFFQKKFGFSLSSVIKTMSIEENKEFSYVFPYDYHERYLQNKQLKLKITLHEYKSVMLHPFDNELAQKEGFKNIEEFKEALKLSALNIHLKKVREIGKKKLIELLLSVYNFPVQDSIIQKYLKEYKDDIKRVMYNYGAKDIEIQNILHSMQNISIVHAKDQAKAEIILMSIAQQENISISENDLDVYVNNESKKNHMSSKKMMSVLKENNILPYIYDHILLEKTLNFAYYKVKKQW